MRRKINKKRINFSFFYKYFFILIFFLIIGYNYEKINANTVSLIEKLSFKYEYIFLDLQIVGLKLINEKIIIDEFEKYKNKSIFFIPLDRISKKIKQNNWVKSVKISNNYKNKLHVNIIEEQPAGIFITKDQNILFSKNFKILDFVDKSEKIYNKLIKFEGHNSIMKSNELIELIPKKFQNSIERAIFVNNRRWNLKLKNNILLKLHEFDINQSIKNYEKIFMKFSNSELSDIKSIDFRIQNKAIIKYD